MGAIPYTATETMKIKICTKVTQNVKYGLKEKEIIHKITIYIKDLNIK